MANTLKIIKKSADVFWHVHNDIALQKFAISDFEISIDVNVFKIVEIDGAKRYNYYVENITIIDETDASVEENYTDVYDFYNRLITIRYTPFNNYVFEIPFYNKIISETGFSLVGQDLTINADWHWILANVPYSNPSSVVINIPYAAAGKQRIDYIVPNNTNGFTRIAGVESTGTPAAPSIPNDNMYATFFVVSDSSIGDPAPPDLSAYATKAYVDSKDALKVDKVTGYSLTKNDLTDVLKSAYDSVVTWVSTNGANLVAHLTNYSNPHNVTAAQVGSPTGSGNSTGTNTGDETTATILTKIGDGSTISSSYLPSYVDDVVEGYLLSNVFYTDSGHTVVIPAATGKIYIDLTTGQKNKEYRYSGSTYIQITNGLIASTDDVPEGSVNKYSTLSLVMSYVLTGISFATGTAITAADTILSAFGKLQKQITDNISANTPDLYFKGVGVDLAGGGETCNILEGGTLYQWYRLVGSTVFSLRTANNSTLDNWTAPVTLVGVSGYFPTVFKYGGVYYMFFNPSDYLTSKKVLMASSTDKINWTLMNSGNTVITNTSISTDWFRTLYNVGACMIGSTIHILIEGNASSGIYVNSSMGYATADISNPMFTLPSNPQISNCGNAQLIYVPEKHSIVALYGYNENVINTVDFKWSIRAATYDLNYDGTLPESWVQSSIMFPYLGESADPELVFTPGKSFKSLLTFNMNQSTGKRGYSDYIDTPLKLYESLPTKGIGNRFLDRLFINKSEDNFLLDALQVNGSAVFQTRNNLADGVTIQTIRNTGSPSQPTLLFKRFNNRVLRSIAMIFSGYAEGGADDGDLAFYTGNGTTATLIMLLGGITKSCKFPFLAGTGTRVAVLGSDGKLLDGGVLLSSLATKTDIKPQINITSASTITITPTKGVVMITFTGTITTATLPPITGNDGLIIFLTNAGSGTSVLNSNTGGSDIWEGGADLTTINVAVGSVMRIINDSIKYRVL